mmetsp:Transcript_111050/g.358213  ORF Transcript_111050/g.358213 Transcript_111050/m.358213 type:complete len:557 (-) Transcript_111050:657-2327(-)
MASGHMGSADADDEVQVAAEDSSDELGHGASKLPWYHSLPYFVAGDIDAFTGVFSNNLATMLAGAQMLTAVLPRDIIFDKIIPGVGISMLFGCLWYTFQALLKAAKTGRTDLCCIPFGINTPGLFAFNSGIIFAVYFAEGRTPEASVLAWKVGVASNFVQGLVEILLAPLGPQISKAVPMVALLGSLSSVGLAWLFANTLQAEVPKVPSTLGPVLLGAALAWALGKAKKEDVDQAMDSIGWHPPVPHFEIFDHLSVVIGYLGIAIPVSLTVAIGTIQVRQMAENAGDNYDLRWTMLGDGLSTVIASLFGSPWGMTVFIGHGAFKAMGAKVGYSLACGLAFAAVCFSGLAALFLAIFPAEVLNPIILFVGLAVCGEALEVTPPRHWPAWIIAIVPGFFNWTLEAAAGFAAAICEAGAVANGSVVVGAACAVDPHSAKAWTLSPKLQAMKSLGEGYLLTSIFWASMVIYIIDRKFLLVAVWASIAALFASCGLVHSDTVFLPWHGPDDHGLHWEFVGGYLLTAGLFVLVDRCQRAGWLPGGVEAKGEEGSDTEEASAE